MKHKSRNILLALICLLVFAGLGFLIYINWVVQKPFATIVFLSSNLTPDVIASARQYGYGANGKLAIEQMPIMGLLKNTCYDHAVPDEVAAVSAIASGQKTNSGVLSVAPNGQPLKTLLTYAKSKGRAVGLVSNTNLLSPTLAAFFAPGANPNNLDQVGNVLFDISRPDVILSGGLNLLLPELKGGKRKDSRDLMLEARRIGYDIVRNTAEMQNTPTWRAPKVMGIFTENDFVFADEIESVGPQPTLAEMVTQAIQLLQYNRNGYLLIIDDGLLSKAAANNQGERLLRETMKLDQAVKAALNYAGEKALVIVAGTVSTGGMSLNGQPLANDRGTALLARRPDGIPAISWATGPGSNPLPQSVDQNNFSSPIQQPSAVNIPQAAPRASDMLLLSRGINSEKLQGFLENTFLFKVLKEGL